WWQDWHKLIPTLRADWHVYACDLRGHGKSGRAGNHYYLADYARDVITFLQRQVNEPVVLVRHSLGSLTAIATAAQAPETVRALVLVDPPLFTRNGGEILMPDVKSWFEFLSHLLSSSPTYDSLAAVFRKEVPGADEAQVKAMV